ncbi:MAG TPA: chloride channel protein, partial [Candidatus Dormibacteraeota bacterium]|nr:chloride channel protein [Candidatus Dormibacteraeota bacterium]
GYDSIQQVLYEHVPAAHAFLLAALKPLATALTLGSGGSGGVFAPSLFIGAFLGDGYGHIVHGLFPLVTGPAAAYGLVAMAALFAAAAEAPITAIMIVFEMSNDYTIILPLMVAVVIASLLGRRLLGATVYEQKLLRRGIDWKKARNPGFYTRLNVGAFLRTPPIVAQIDETVSSVIMQEYGVNELAVPVCDGTRFVGVVTSLDLARAASSDRGAATMRSIMHLNPITLSPTDTLDRAALLMAEIDTPLLPVTDSDGAILGILTRHDLLDAYRSANNA